MTPLPMQTRQAWYRCPRCLAIAQNGPAQLLRRPLRQRRAEPYTRTWAPRLWTPRLSSAPVEPGTRCSVPECNGANSSLTRWQEDAIRQVSSTAASGQRRALEPNPKGGSVVPHPCRPMWPQPQNRPDMAQPTRHRRRGHEAQATRHDARRGAGEAAIAEFRRRTLLPLGDVRRSLRNDVSGCLKDQAPKFTRTAAWCATASPVCPGIEQTSSKRKTSKGTRTGCARVGSVHGCPPAPRPMPRPLSEPSSIPCWTLSVMSRAPRSAPGCRKACSALARRPGGCSTCRTNSVDQPWRAPRDRIARPRRSRARVPAGPARLTALERDGPRQDEADAQVGSRISSFADVRAVGGNKSLGSPGSPPSSLKK